jgi:hypothetical protein
MWFIAAWHAWRSLAVSRLRFKTMLGLHMQLSGTLSLELAFKAWVKVADAQVRQSWVKLGLSYLTRIYGDAVGGGMGQCHRRTAQSKLVQCYWTGVLVCSKLFSGCSKDSRVTHSCPHISFQVAFFCFDTYVRVSTEHGLLSE